MENRRFDGSSFDDRQTSTKRNRLATHFFFPSSSSISFSFFLFLSPHARTIFCSSRTRLSRAQRNLRSLPWHCTKTIIRFNTYTRDACNDKFHPLDDVPPPFPLPIFYSFSSFSRIGMPLTSFNLLGLACFNRTIMAVRIAKDKQESLIELWKSVRDINWF